METEAKEENEAMGRSIHSLQEYCCRPNQGQECCFFNKFITDYYQSKKEDMKKQVNVHEKEAVPTIQAGEAVAL